ncbi:MAG: DegV family protein [Oscillospiraceae bacterium]|nr:DegV family protein [Oscillospiraceae bacterium]
MHIIVSSDSTCDLSPELIEQFGIRIIPLYIVKGEQAYKDTIEISPEDIFEWVSSGKGVCSTSAVNTADYIDFFSSLRKDCDAVIHFTISSEMSACYANACLAAEEVDNIYVVDSRNLSTGIGNLVLDAAAMAKEGTLSAEDIYNAVQAETGLAETSFIIDKLDYLAKGGRCSSLAAFGANLLNLKLCIEVVDGKMSVGKKYRGNFDKVILQYVKDRLKDRDDIDPRRIFITYAKGVPRETGDRVEEAVRSLVPFTTVYHTYAGCTISNHCGPVCLGILFFRKPQAPA